MKRLPRGFLKPFAEKSGIPATYISAIIARTKLPGRVRAKKLETAAKELGKEVPAALWLYGSRDEIKQAVTRNRKGKKL